MFCDVLQYFWCEITELCRAVWLKSSVDCLMTLGRVYQMWLLLLLHCCIISRAVPNSGSVLFGQIRIIDAIIRPNTNRIRIVELWISVIVIGYIIVNIIIIILSGSSSSIISRPMYKSENTKTTLKLKMKSVFRPTSETSLQFHIKFALRKTGHSRFSASKQVSLSSAVSPVELKRRSLGTIIAGAAK